MDLTYLQPRAITATVEALPCPGNFFWKTFAHGYEMGVQTFWQGLLNEIPIYFTCYCEISKLYDFLKSKIGSVLEVRTLLTVQDFLESWVFQNHWVAIFLIVFIVVTLELILIKIWTYLWKKTVHPNKECSCSSFQKVSMYD